MSMEHIEEVRSEIKSVMSSSRQIDADELRVSTYVRNLEDVIVKEEQLELEKDRIEIEKDRLKIQKAESRHKRALEKERQDRELTLREREMTLAERKMDLDEERLKLEKARIESEERIAERQASNQVAAFIGNMILGGSKVVSFLTLGLIDMNNTYRDDGRTSKFFNRMHDKVIQN